MLYGGVSPMYVYFSLYGERLVGWRERGRFSNVMIFPSNSVPFILIPFTFLFQRSPNFVADHRSYTWDSLKPIDVRNFFLFYSFFVFFFYFYFNLMLFYIGQSIFEHYSLIENSTLNIRTCINVYTYVCMYVEIEGSLLIY